MDYTTKEQFTVYKADSPEEAEVGDRVVRIEITNMKGEGNNGEDVDTDFVQIRKGSLEEDGAFGVSPEFAGGPQDAKSVGSADPEDLQLIADGLEQVAEELE